MAASAPLEGDAPDEPLIGRRASFPALRPRTNLAACFVILLASLAVAARVLTTPQTCVPDASATAPAAASSGQQMSAELYREVLAHMPIPTCDVLLLSPARDTTLLFKRTNRPVQGWFYTLGGRLAKNETLRGCAARKLAQEFGLAKGPESLVFGGIVEERFNDSAFPHINSHCINSVFGYALTRREHFATRKRVRMDGQHSKSAWFRLDDPGLHPYVREKIDLVRERIGK